MSKIKGAIVVDTGRCKGCSLCGGLSSACHRIGREKVNVHGYRYVEAAVPDACVGCTSCAIVCPDGCITVYRKKED